jgi:hypothetical protein
MAKTFFQMRWPCDNVGKHELFFVRLTLTPQAPAAIINICSMILLAAMVWLKGGQ